MVCPQVSLQKVPEIYAIALTLFSKTAVWWVKRPTPYPKPRCPRPLGCTPTSTSPLIPHLNADSPPSPQLDRVPPLLSPETLTSTTSWRRSSQLHRCRIHLASSDGQFSRVKFPRIPGILVGRERQVIKKLNVLFIQKTSVYFLLKTIIF